VISSAIQSAGNDGSEGAVPNLRVQNTVDGATFVACRAGTAGGITGVGWVTGIIVALSKCVMHAG